MPLTEDLKNIFGRQFKDRVSFDEPMSRHTSFKVGGPAQVFARPRSMEEAVSLIQFSRSESLPLLVVGDGTNLIVRDGGIQGMVLSLSGMAQDIRWDEQDDETIRVHAHAGIKTKDLCKQAWKKGYAGLNFALGIPGTLGGNIAMNAGTQMGAMDQVLLNLGVLNGSGRMKTIGRSDLHFSYRHLGWPQGMDEPVILSATLCLSKGDPEALAQEARRILKARTKNQPVSLPNAGCIFKNPENHEPAGKLIDMAGLKGFSMGGARISEKHANFIVNENKARATDILALVKKIKDTVFARWGVDLETEVTIVGKD
ncbi:MAG: UDP-N-acetylmuramate dehydrogenase [Proteobacteria bacterium]|nr:UDP-N-acetylmuramate dehydrogenase [Pseudomonadota bacterium]